MTTFFKAVAAALLALGCAGTEALAPVVGTASAVKVARVDFQPDSVVCTVGAAVPVSATVTLRSGARDTAVPVDFFTRNPAVAAVSKTAPQRATVGCQVKGLTWTGAGLQGRRDSAATRVCAPSTTALSPDTLQLIEGGSSGQLIALELPDCAPVESGTFAYTVRDTTIVAPIVDVDDSATVVPRAAGSTWILATSPVSGTDSSLAIVAAEIPPPASCTPTATHLCPGDAYQTKITAQADGIAFTLGAGIFRDFAVTPKTNQTFDGAGPTATILNGADSLDNWTQDGAYWWAAFSASTEHKNEGQCAATHTLCYETEIVWIDDVLQIRVGTLGEVLPGKVFYDEAADKVWIAVDPAGKVIEAAEQARAFAGATITGVQISDLTVKRYANSNNYGAIGYQQSGAGWTVTNVVAEENHGIGIKAFTNWTVTLSKMTRNGQMGYSCSGNGPYIYRNEIAFNNTNGNITGPVAGAGAGKCVLTDGLIFRRNFAHHNQGPGPWTDIDNIRSTIDSNVVEDNDWRGIFHEISYEATIRHNVVRRNGFRTPFASPGACDRAGILVSNSPNVTVDSNVVEDNFHGIMVIETDRAGGAHGLHNTSNLVVRDNDVQQTGNRAAGICDTDPAFDPYAANNFYISNRYVCAPATRFRWNQLDIATAAWLLVPQDAGATFSGC